MNKSERLSKLFAELAKEFGWNFSEDMTSVVIFSPVDEKGISANIISADFNEKGPTEFYLYSSSRGYEEFTQLAVVRKNSVRELALSLTQE